MACSNELSMVIGDKSPMIKPAAGLLVITPDYVN
jgi:hypothetical protein